jgi:DnaJ-class molecular chaperone
MPYCQHVNEQGIVCEAELTECAHCDGEGERDDSLLGLTKVKCSVCDGRGRYCYVHHTDFD